MTEVENKPYKTKTRYVMIPLFQYLLKAAILTGIVFSIINLLHGRSLWLDEAMLALNIVNKSYSELLKPLAMDQIAPVGFLFIQKSFVLVLGNHDWVLRLFPLICFLISIPLFYRLNVKLFDSADMALLACAFFSLNLSLVSYSIEIKQYSSDVLIALLIILATIHSDSFDKKFPASLAVLGAVSIWFSNIAVIALFTSGITIIYKGLRHSKETFYLTMVPVMCWIVSFAMYYSFFIFHHPASKMMTEFWSKENAFMPTDLFGSHFFSFLNGRFRDLFQSFMVFKEVWIFHLLFYLFGLLAMRNSGKALFLMTFTIFLHLVLSAFKLYPFHLRLSLYLIPFIISVFSFGLWSSFLQVRRYLPRLPVYIILLPIGVYLVSLIKVVPEEKEEIKRSMSHVSEHIRPDEGIYVYYSSIPAFRYYMNKYPGISNHPAVIYGKSSRDEWHHYTDDLKIKGTCWFIFSHVYWIKQNQIDEEEYIINTLRSKGYLLLDKRVFKGSAVYKMKY